MNRGTGDAGKLGQGIVGLGITGNGDVAHQRNSDHNQKHNGPNKPSGVVVGSGGSRQMIGHNCNSVSPGSFPVKSRIALLQNNYTTKPEIYKTQPFASKGLGKTFMVLN